MLISGDILDYVDIYKGVKIQLDPFENLRLRGRFLNYKFL